MTMPPYDHELIAGKRENGLGQIFPIYIALIDNNWAIVR